MNPDMTRRTLLQLAGASSLAAAAAGAARAEEGGGGGGPTFANRTPMRIGMVTIRVRKLDAMADYYRDVLGLTVMERAATGAVLGAMLYKDGVIVAQRVGALGKSELATFVDRAV